MFKAAGGSGKDGYDPMGGNHPNNPAYWCNGGKNLEELLDVEWRYAERALHPPDWMDADIVWEVMHGKPYFRKGRPSPMYNTSKGVARAIHPGYNYNFPAPDTKLEERPGWRTTKPFRCNTFDGIEKPLIGGGIAGFTWTGKHWLEDDEAFERLLAGNAAAPPKAPSEASAASSRRWRGSRAQRRLAQSASAPDLDAASVASGVSSLTSTHRSESAASLRSLGVASLGSVARSKLAMRPYHFGAVPGGKWPTHGTRVLVQRTHEDERASGGGPLATPAPGVEPAALRQSTFIRETGTLPGTRRDNMSY